MHSARTRRAVLIATALAGLIPNAASAADKVKGVMLTGETFVVSGRPAFVLTPPKEKQSQPQPWVFYAPTLPAYPDVHEKWMHEQFLAAGIAVAGIDVGESFGSPEGRKHFSALYRELTKARGFALRPCMLGRSRGGLWVTSWAADNPEKVAGIAGIYPVFDLRTYPGLPNAAPAYGLTADALEARLGELNPINRVSVLASQRVPAYFIHGDEDKVVPLKENSAEFVARYTAAGVKDLVTLNVAKGQGHNFWEGFFHCQGLVDFAIKTARQGAKERAAGPPKVVEQVVVYREKGRFAGWPANHGIWSWGDEILVGFSRGHDKDNGPNHHIDHDQPEEFLLARSMDGGHSWKVEEPRPAGALVGTAGMRHGKVPPGAPVENPSELDRKMDFTHPDFALTVRMENSNNGVSRYYYSYDRGRAWRGPYRLPLFGQKGVMGRTDYLVNGPNDCLLFLTASKDDGREGRPFAARTTDGGRSWSFLSFIGPEPSGYSIMPSTARIAPHALVATIRRKDGPKSWIDAYGSNNDGRSWTFLSTPEPDTGEGNPPSLVRLDDGRLALIYGVRAAPSGIRARLSGDGGKSWGLPVTLRDDGGSNDIGYVRSIVRLDGNVVSIYYYSDRSGPTRYLGATIWSAGTH